MEKQLGDTPSELERLRELLGQRDAELKKRETRMGELSDESFKLSEQAKATELRLKTVEEKFQERVQQLDLQVSAQKDAIADANEDARLKAVSIGELEKKLKKVSDAHNLVHAKVCIMTQELTGMYCDSYLHLFSLLSLPVCCRADEDMPRCR